MDSDLIQFLLQVAPSLSSTLPQIVEKLRTRKKSEIYSLLNITLLARIAEVNTIIKECLRDIQKKATSAEEATHILLKRTEK